MENTTLIKQETWLKKHEKDFIRAELNLCKLLFLWETSKSKKKSKVIEQKEILPNGDIRIKKITIEGIGENHKLLTIKKHFKTILALFKIYEDAGKSDKVIFGIHQLATILNRSWSGKTYKELKEALLELRKIPITFENIFYNKKTGEVEEFIECFTWLEELKIYGKLKNRQANLALSTFSFNKYIRQNILNNYTKPLFLNTITNFKTEIAILLYNHIDLIMADKGCYERNLKNLIEVDFRLDGKYPSPGHRKILFSKAIKELEGVKLTTGVLTSIHLEKTKDGKDYKIVCRKSLPSLAEKGRGELATALINTQAQDLINYFHNKIDPQKTHIATDKELKQAQDLLNEYGEGKSKQFIDYSIKQANKTNFEMQFLGAILNYIPQANEDFKQKEQKQLQQKAKEKERRKLEELQIAYYEYKKAVMENYKNSITEEQYQKELEDVKQEYIKKYPWIKTQHWEGSTLQGTAEANYKDWLIVQNKIKLLNFDEWKKEKEKDSAIAVK